MKTFESTFMLILDKFAIIYRWWIKQLLLYKKLFVRINHHQRLNEYVLQNLFSFYQTLILIVKSNEKQYNKLKRRKNALCSWEFALCHQLLFVTPFLNKTSLSQSFCLFRSGLQRAINDTSKFFLVLTFFWTFEITAHAKQWFMLHRRCFDGSEV